MPSVWHFHGPGNNHDVICFYMSPFVKSLWWILSKGQKKKKGLCCSLIVSNQAVAAWCSSRVSPIWRKHPGSQNCQCFLPKGEHQLDAATWSAWAGALQAQLQWVTDCHSTQHPEEVTSEETQVLSWGLLHHLKGKWVEGLCAGEGRFPYYHQLLARDALFTSLPLNLLLKGPR